MQISLPRGKSNIYSFYVKKGVKSDGKKKKSGNGRIEGILDRKNAFE